MSRKVKNPRANHIPFHIYIPKELKEKFSALCKARKYSRSEVIEKLIKIYIEQADENGWTEYIETRCISCQKIFTQERLKEKKWCSPECHLYYVTFIMKWNCRHSLY